jgi:hypothetical protein
MKYIENNILWKYCRPITVHELRHESVYQHLKQTPLQIQYFSYLLLNN